MRSIFLFLFEFYVNMCYNISYLKFHLCYGGTVMKNWIQITFSSKDNASKRDFPSIGDIVYDESNKRIGEVINVSSPEMLHASGVYFKPDDGVARYAYPGYIDAEENEFVMFCDKPAYYCRRCTLRDNEQCYFNGGKHVVYAYHR